MKDMTVTERKVFKNMCHIYYVNVKKILSVYAMLLSLCCKNNRLSYVFLVERIASVIYRCMTSMKRYLKVVFSNLR